MQLDNNGKLVKAYIKGIPNDIEKNIQKVQQYVNNKYSGRLTIPENKIDLDKRLLYYKFPTHGKPTNYTTDKLSEKLAKESKETVQQQRIRQAVQFVTDPLKFGVNDFTNDEIKKAEKILEDEQKKTDDSLVVKKIKEAEEKKVVEEANAAQLERERVMYEEQKALAEHAKALAEQRLVEMKETELKRNDLLKVIEEQLKKSKLTLNDIDIQKFVTLDDLEQLSKAISYFRYVGANKYKRIFDSPLLENVIWEGHIVTKLKNRGQYTQRLIIPSPAEDNRRILAVVNNLTPNQIKEVNKQVGNFDKVGGSSGDEYSPENQPKANKLPALWSDQIEDYFDKYPHFAGTIAADEIDELPNNIPMGFIMNTNDRDNDDMGHWVATYINGDSTEYYDPLGDPPNKKYISDIKKKLESMHIPILMKFKVNMVKDQHSNSQHCGYHCIRFLDDRFNNIDYPMTTRYNTKASEKINNDSNGEKTIKDEFMLI